MVERLASSEGLLLVQTRQAETADDVTMMGRPVLSWTDWGDQSSAGRTGICVKVLKVSNSKSIISSGAHVALEQQSYSGSGCWFYFKHILSPSDARLLQERGKGGE